MLPEKLSGVYLHNVIHRKKILMRGMDDEFYVPQSRYTGLDEEKVRSNPELYVVADSPEAGSYLILAYSSRQVFVTGHSEYDPWTLKNEYERDKNAGLPIDIPVNYFPDDDDTRDPIVRWRSGANLLYSNWLNYFVYQTTPYDINEIQ
jgi:homoserine O-succinyltransferase